MTAPKPPHNPAIDAHDWLDKCPPDSVEHWQALARAADQRATREHDAYMRLLTTDARRQRDAAAAYRREAWRHCLQSLKFYLVTEAASFLWRFGQNLEAISTRMPERTSSQHADRATIQALGRVARQLAGAAKDMAAIKDGGVFAELRRLRAALDHAGRMLHQDHGTDGGDRCDCPGCELIREAHLHPGAAAASPESSVPAALGR